MSLLDAKGKLIFPDLPGGDHFALCEWLTEALDLDPTHPVIGAKHEGRRGPEGHVVLVRREAPSVRFEPASVVNTPQKLIAVLSWSLLPSDGPVPGFQATHCRQLTTAIRRLVGVIAARTTEQETAALVSSYLGGAQPMEGHTTYGTAGESYEAATALRRETDPVTGRAVGPARCLIDRDTGEWVVGVGDLQDAARRYEGSSLPRGWLDARMEALGWKRITIDGHQLPGRAGRQGPHARITGYRGHLANNSGDEGDDTVGGVTT